MKLLTSSLMLVAIMGMTTIGCGEPTAKEPAAPAASAPAEGGADAAPAAGSGEKEAPAEGGADAGSDKKEG